MNWYKQAKLDKQAGKGLWTGFGWITIPAIIALIGGATYDALKEKPQELAQQVQQVQQGVVEPNDMTIEVNEPNVVQEPNEPVVETNEPNNIDLDKIWFMESTRGTHPDMEKSDAGARGHFQFMENTWNDLVKRMGVDWDWKNGSMDYEQSKAVADFYFHTRIPEMLKHYGIHDTIRARLASYDAGIGVVKSLWEQYGEEWETSYMVPDETEEYFRRYGV